MSNCSQELLSLASGKNEDDYGNVEYFLESKSIPLSWRYGYYSDNRYFVLWYCRLNDSVNLNILRNGWIRDQIEIPMEEWLELRETVILGSPLAFNSLRREWFERMVRIVDRRPSSLY